MQGWGIPGALGTAELLGLARQRVLENSAALQGHISVPTPPPTHTGAPDSLPVSELSPSTLLFSLTCGNHHQPE